MKIFPYSENELLEIASDFKKNLKDHFDSIKEFCPGLTQEFIYKFKALFYEVQSPPLEPDADPVVKELKLVLDDLSNQVNSLFPIFRFYMQKAFPYDSNLWESYQYSEIEKAMLDYSLLRTCLEGSVKIIEDKRAELRAANCPNPTLNEIVDLSKQINDKHDEYLEYLRNKEFRFKVYQNNLNELFKLMKMVHDAATKCFQNNPEYLKKLTFPAKKHSPQL